MEIFYSNSFSGLFAKKGIICRRRARTLPLVEEIDKKMLKALRRKRAYFLRIPRNSPALKRAMRESYFMHVYHTVAIEGNTMTLVQTRYYHFLY